MALIAAGTGLGMALIPQVGERWVPVPSEGGHMDFAPRTEDEIGLMRHLRERFGRVSVERVVSGPGLYNVYQYLRDVSGCPRAPKYARQCARRSAGGRIRRGSLASQGLQGAPAATVAVSARGRSRCSWRPMVRRRGTWRSSARPRAASGWAGGSRPKILPRLSDGLFLQTFIAKGRFVPFLEKVPVRVVLNDRAALLGAARRAASLLNL